MIDNKHLKYNRYSSIKRENYRERGDRKMISKAKYEKIDFNLKMDTIISF